MNNFWDPGVWGVMNIMGMLLVSMLAASMLKKAVKKLADALIPTSVLAGGILLLISGIYKFITGVSLFQTPFMGGEGFAFLEMITYHALALGFISSTFESNEGELSAKRKTEIFNTGITTVGTYLVQAISGLAITMIAAKVIEGFFPVAGLLLPFGYGQGTGQAMNYGNIYETQYGFVGGKSFGLTIATLGFICGSMGGVFHLSYLKKKNHLHKQNGPTMKAALDKTTKEGDIPLFENMDTLSVQVAFIMGSYLLTYVIMYILGELVPGMKSVIYGFNFLIGVLVTTGVKKVIASLEQKGILKKHYINDFIMGLSFLEREELVRLEPNIGSTVSCALRAETGAIVCPYELCMAAVGNAMDNGCELKLGFRVEGIEEKDGVYRVSSSEETVEAKTVINCAGVYSDDIAALVGDDSFSVRPRRGEYMLLDKECGSLVGHTVFRCPSKMGKGVLVSPTVDGNLLLGPTAEDIDDKTDTSTTADGLARVASLAGNQVNGISFGKVITSFTGLRATGSTGDFIINSPKRGFINCAGIESPGLTSAPAIAVYVADMLKNDGFALEKNDSFNGTRRPSHYFRELSEDEKNEIIKQNPDYAQVICRCETVTAGEIIEAIRTNPKPTDVDGVKRRTRATMGRCQGGFCTPYIVEILAREMGVPVTDITKSGGRSYINVGKTDKGKM